ncbi:IclR family transcriptional regulator [Mesorhizobium sp. 10J20-29]
MRIRQLDNALDLIEVFAQQKTPMTLTQISRAIGMPKSSAFNLIDTLLTRGLIYEINARSSYYPTRRLFDLCKDFMEGDPFLQLIHGQLEALATSTGETVLIASRDPHSRNEIVYIDVVESTALIRYFAKVGDKRPIYTTSSGKAILSGYPREERLRILASLTYVQHQSGTVTDDEELNAVIDASIARGWCEDNAEFTPDVMGIAVPIRYGDRHFGLALAGPIYRMHARRTQLAELLRIAAKQIHSLLARDRPQPLVDAR